MIFIAAVLAGLFFALRELLPYLSAQASGSIKRRGYNGGVVRRSEDPERFSALLRNRLKGALAGFGIVVVAVVVWIALSVLPALGSRLPAP